jgi:hypothetical protein
MLLTVLHFSCLLALAMRAQDELGRELFNAADNNRLAEARELLGLSTAHVNWNKNDVSGGGGCACRDCALACCTDAHVVTGLSCPAQRGETPLLQAAYKGYLDLCKLLVERGADLNLQDKV